LLNLLTDLLIDLAIDCLQFIVDRLGTMPDIFIFAMVRRIDQFVLQAVEHLDALT
jgi:hypothetical protein